MHTTRLTTVALLLCFCLPVFGQSFSDDFEGYNAGDYIGQVSSDWTTWNGQTGGTIDCQVVNSNASSGTNSLHLFNTAAGGGPMDLVLPFGGEYNVGQFSYEMAMWVEQGHGGYFNFQEESTIGNVWAMDCWFNQAGEMRIIASGNEVLLVNYPLEQWFDLRIDINLNTNTWELFIDNVSQGNWANVENQLASINLYPVNNEDYGGNTESSFYVDDVSYTYTPYTVGGLNGSITDINLHTGLTNVDTEPTITIRNLGIDAITSFDVTVEHDGDQINQSFSGLNIASLGETRVNMTNAIGLSANDNSVVATLSNVNGMGQDDNAADDVKSKTLSLVTPAVGKMVVVEEATGTWCQWCPRGAVMLDSMTARYPDHMVGIAVHNGDPMVYEPYDTGIGDYISGYPAVVTNRDASLDPLGIEGTFLERIDDAPQGSLSLGAEQNGTVLTFSITTEWLAPTTPGWKVALVLVEDGLSGTTAQWAQSNAYAGGGNGVMGGYELLPTPVPASQMVYDHVGRVIAPAFDGYGGHFAETATMPTGSEWTLNLDVDMDPIWDINNMHVVGMLFNDSGLIDNATSTTLMEAIGTGLTIGEPVAVEQRDLSRGLGMDLAPNPASGMTYLSVTAEKPSAMRMTVTDLNGRVVGQRNYGMMHGTFQLPVAVDQLESGIYLVTLTTDTEQRVRKLVVE